MVGVGDGNRTSAELKTDNLIRARVTINGLTKHIWAETGPLTDPRFRAPSRRPAREPSDSLPRKLLVSPMRDGYRQVGRVERDCAGFQVARTLGLLLAGKVAPV